MAGTLHAAAPPLSPLSIFLLVASLHLLDGFLDRLNKGGSRSSEENELRQEINYLLKEASSLSTPSTFAQAAKLRRKAAALEKELAKKQEQNKEKKWSYTNALLVFKVFLYAVLIWWFWSVPVAAVPQHLLQPLGRVLSWKVKDSSTGHIMVGIIPWLVLTSRVSKYLFQRLSKVLPQK